MFNTTTTRFILAVSLAFGGSAHAMSTDPVGNGSDYPPFAKGSSNLTRAQVQADFVQARNSGMLLLKNDEFQFNSHERGMGPSRAEVIKGATQARMAGTLPQGDSFGE
ncbi:DUF4148 domain-containing protein [Comamonas piscis]|uniref:DUF4148 domain-containing protein n=1 Tax=Comamonas piscis TaxID=1562974 RepID=A0A7G5EEI4_9BURK|nr:DUF4148 domain-containing protein [Comamonas piscis]QMV72409.1 DUF4148 domain-containing protein [Comamonas piscis]WSO35177.1 DUF4148 domain-containing protein [Comamonas piscis]